MGFCYHLIGLRLLELIVGETLKANTLIAGEGNNRLKPLDLSP